MQGRAGWMRCVRAMTHLTLLPESLKAASASPVQLHEISGPDDAARNVRHHQVPSMPRAAHLGREHDLPRLT